MVDLVKECLRGEFCHLVDIPVDAGYRWGGQLAPEHIVKSDDGNIARTVFSQLPQRLEKKHSQPVSAGDDSGGEIPGDAFLNIQADGITGLIQIDLRDAGTAQGMVGGEKCPLISGNLVLFGEAVCFFYQKQHIFVSALKKIGSSGVKCFGVIKKNPRCDIVIDESFDTDKRDTGFI